MRPYNIPAPICLRAHAIAKEPFCSSRSSKARLSLQHFPLSRRRVPAGHVSECSVVPPKKPLLFLLPARHYFCRLNFGWRARERVLNQHLCTSVSSEPRSVAVLRAEVSNLELYSLISMHQDTSHSLHNLNRLKVYSNLRAYFYLYPNVKKQKL